MFWIRLSQKWCWALFSMRVTELLPLPAVPGDRGGAGGAGAGAGGGDLGGDRDGAGGVPGHVHVVDLVIAQVGRVRHHRQIGAIQFEAHVHLLGQAVEDLGQGLVDGVEGHRAADARVDIHVELGVPGQGEQQLLHLDVIHHHRIGLGAGGDPGFGQGRRLHHRCRNGAADHGRRVRLQVGLAGVLGNGGGAGAEQSQGIVLPAGRARGNAWATTGGRRGGGRNGQGFIGAGLIGCLVMGPFLCNAMF